MSSMIRLLGSLLFVLAVSAGTSMGGTLPAALDTNASPPKDPSATSEQIAALEAEVRRRINAVRSEHGLDPLEGDPVLAKVARDFSRRMSREGFFSHTGPSGDSVEDRVREAGVRFRMVGENIYMSYNVEDPVEKAVQGWMGSPGHRANILREGFTRTGVGIWKDGQTYHFTQVFLRPR